MGQIDPIRSGHVDIESRVTSLMGKQSEVKESLKIITQDHGELKNKASFLQAKNTDLAAKLSSATEDNGTLASTNAKLTDRLASAEASADQKASGLRRSEEAVASLTKRAAKAEGELANQLSITLSIKRVYSAEEASRTKHDDIIRDLGLKNKALSEEVEALKKSG
jgi:chromosome segregation ATPase